MKYDLNKHVARLLMNEPFFASLSRNVDKKVGPIPTACVRVNPDTARFEMLYCPEFFEGLPDEHVRGILKHEFYHLLFEHVTGRMPDEVRSDFAGKGKMWNFATDLAINSHLKGELPSGCLMPGEAPFEEFPIGKSAEWYYEALKKTAKEEGEEGEPGEPGEGGEGEGQGSATGEGTEGEENKDGKGAGKEPQTLDDHSMWGQDDTANEIAKERLKEAVKKAAGEAAKAGSWGSVGGDCRRDITDRLLTTKVDWRNILRYFIKTSQRASRRSTIKRINKRYPYIHPGRKQTRQAKIAISIDQSGSVDDQMLQAFFAELNKLATLAEFTVVPFDTEVAKDAVFVWKKGENRKWERVACGGTCFEAPTDYVNEKGFDGHIVLTDMCAPKPKASKCQRMWMTTDYYAKNPYFKTSERVIGIEA
jgi:predicted metal-dependent peptidase